MGVIEPPKCRFPKVLRSNRLTLPTTAKKNQLQFYAIDKEAISRNRKQHVGSV